LLIPDAGACGRSGGRFPVSSVGPGPPLESAAARSREVPTIKRTFQPKKRYRRRVHGFLRRMGTAAGARVIRHRRRKGRSNLTPR
jgi:large subunit ribosomal protein L34